MDSAANRQRNLDVLRSIRREVVQLHRHLGQQTCYYDVFLCYNTDDRPVIKQIGDQLLEMNILPWLDDWEVQPGQNWYQVLNRHIEAIGAVAVFVGKDSPAPWYDSQIDPLLRTFAKKHRIIPMILSECGQLPQLPNYIKEPWIDMRILDYDPIISLVECIALK